MHCFILYFLISSSFLPLLSVSVSVFLLHRMNVSQLAVALMVAKTASLLAAATPGSCALTEITVWRDTTMAIATRSATMAGVCMMGTTACPQQRFVLASKLIFCLLALHDY